LKTEFLIIVLWFGSGGVGCGGGGGDFISPNTAIRPEFCKQNESWRELLKIIAFDDFRTQGLLSSLLLSGICLKSSLPHIPSASLDIILHVGVTPIGRSFTAA